MTASDISALRVPQSWRTERVAQVVDAILRASVCACFVGHGAFGLRQKRDWLAFFHPFGIGDDTAFTLMPIIGTVDISIGILALLWPARAALVYAAVWGFFTASLRPIAGMSVFELLERGGNFGPALALLVASAGTPWLAVHRPPEVESVRTSDRQRAVLTGSTVLLLLGHGGLSLLAKPTFVRNWASTGLVAAGDAGAAWTRAVGVLELGMAALLLWRPTRGLALLVMGWKLLSEAMFLSAGDPIWEFVERGGSYGAPLALWFLLGTRR